MKLLYIVNARIPTEKAHGLQIMKMAEAFTSQGADVTLFLPGRRNDIKKTAEDYYGLKTKLKKVILPNIFFFLEYIVPPLYFMVGRAYFNISAIIYTLYVRPDVVFSREIGICFFLSLMGKRVYFEDHEPKKSYLFLYRIFIRSIYRKIAVPFALADYYRFAGVPERTYLTVPNGVDLAEFDATGRITYAFKKIIGTEGEGKKILYVGHFYEWKGVNTLIESADTIDRGTIFLVGGNDKDREKVLQYAKDKGSRNVVVHKFIPHREIIKLIKAADILVLPNTAKEERSLKYTTPIKLFEYMASGVPIVASDIPSFEHFLADGVNAKLFEPDDPSDLAQKINYILDNGDYGADLARNAYENVRKYTWEERARKILDFMKD